MCTVLKIDDLIAFQTQHTLVLVQETPNKGSRTYYDFETVKDAVNGMNFFLFFIPILL